MRRGHWLGTAAVAVSISVALLGAAMAKSGKDAKGDKAAKAKDDPVERGRYLVSFSGCNDCHTPWVFNKDLGMPVPDHTRFLSGHPVGAPEPSEVSPSLMAGVKSDGVALPSCSLAAMPSA